MRILFDQGAPKPLAAYLPGHAIKLASQMGWSTLKNGELLFAAEEASFELMIIRSGPNDQGRFVNSVLNHLTH